MTESHQHGFMLRPALFDDLPELVDIFNMYARETDSETHFTAEGYRREWIHEGFTLEDDTRAAVLPDGRVVGVVEFWNFAPYVMSWVWARVHPEYRGRGIGSALMEWAEQRAQVSLTRAEPGTRVMIRAGVPSTDMISTKLLEDRGFTLIRHSFTMVRELDGEIPAPMLPPNIIIRSMQPGEEATVYRATDEAFKDHWGYVSVPFEEGFKRQQERTARDPHYDPSLWFLAMDGDEVAGMSLCWATTEELPEAGWVGTLGVRRAWRKHGLGQALLYHSFRELQARGRRRVGLGVDASSLTGATRLYERAGMRPISQFAQFEKELRAGVDLTTQAVEE